MADDAYSQNLDCLDYEEGILPLNSKLPDPQDYVNSYRIGHSNEDVQEMEKTNFALNITATLAYALNVPTPYSNIGNPISKAMFYDQSMNFTDNM